MEQIKIFFFVIGTFFGMDDSKIAAAHTTVTINPQKKEIVILQEHLITSIKAEGEKTVALAEWDKLYNRKDNNLTWASELDSFAKKNLLFKKTDDKILVEFTLTYTTEKDLRAFGIWYNEGTKQFSTNHIPQHHLKSAEGAVVGNYVIFESDKTFRFTLEPFKDMPEQYKHLIKSIDELLAEKGE